MTFKSFSSEDTKRFAENFAAVLMRRAARGQKRSGACILALSGDLGSGKTVFVQGFVRGLGIKKRTTSPTFILFRRFGIPSGRTARTKTQFRNVFHVDAYRIKKPKELLMLGFGSILKDPRNIVVIEWPENIKRVLPKTTTRIRLRHKKEHNQRDILV